MDWVITFGEVHSEKESRSVLFVNNVLARMLGIGSVFGVSSGGVAKVYRGWVLVKPITFCEMKYIVWQPRHEPAKGSDTGMRTHRPTVLNRLP